MCRRCICMALFFVHPSVQIIRKTLPGSSH
jgi:hypothetical protein